ncbi:MAG: SRPBCC family protein [bacterium]|nr:SRPBCC family protein [bacterium]
MAQEKNQKIVKEQLSIIINVPADSLWAICREFDKTGEWTSTLKHSYASGEPQFEGATCSARTCETNFGSGKKVVEELIMFNDEKRELAYNLTEGAPGFVTLAQNHWKVDELSPNHSKIEMNVTIHMNKFSGMLLGGVMTKQMRKQVNIVLDELKTFAETGEVSEAKKKQLEKRRQNEIL